LARTVLTSAAKTQGGQSQPRTEEKDVGQMRLAISLKS